MHGNRESCLIHESKELIGDGVSESAGTRKIGAMFNRIEQLPVNTLQ
jgi:hypothetical protein